MNVVYTACHTLLATLANRRSHPACQNDSDNLHESDADANANQNYSITTDAFLQLHEASILYGNYNCITYLWLLEMLVNVFVHTSLVVFLLIGRCILAAIFRDHVNSVRLATAGAQCLVFAIVRPVCRSVYAAAHQLLLHIVPGLDVVHVWAYNRLLQGFAKHSFKIRLENTSGNTAAHFDDEYNAQQDGKLNTRNIQFNEVLLVS